ncbi:MAG: HAMP domain-containing histidine kinase [Treponema sp.]|nr:HAMP domain-containing histidine kinase [Treponema sp.]
MKNLRKKIVWYFILCAFLLQVVLSVIDSTMGTLVDSNFTEEAVEGLSVGGFSVLFALFIGLQVFFFIAAAFVFFLLVRKAVKKESERQAEEQRLMYASLAHDLKTPLTSVVGFSSSLIDKKIPAEKQEEVVQTIHDKAVQMNGLLESMLSYSKLNSEAFTLNAQKKDFCAFVKNLAALNYNDFEAHKINVDVQIPDTPIITRIDEKELGRAISNLFANVWIHNQQGINVLIKITEEKDMARLVIADTGTKIDPKQAENLFNPFVSGNAARTSGKSSGLGLAIARAAADCHGGKLYIDFNQAEYSKAFVMEIPVCKEK